MEEIRKSAKNVEDAIAAALKELGASREEVDITVIEEGSKGFLGMFGGKDAVVLVKKNFNPEKEAEGFTTALDELGYKYVVKYPEQATADAQITMINELVAQNVSSIAIAANDADALQPALTAAANAS